MKEENIQIKLLNDNAKIPTYGSNDAAGADIYANINTAITIKPHETVFIKTGLAFAIPKGLVGLVYARSGLSCKQGLAPANKVGVIDSDYRGELMVALHNHSEERKIINPNDRIAQIVFTPYIKASFIETDNLDETTRGNGGFGSTGKN